MATDDTHFQVRQYTIRFKKSGTRVPRVALAEMGPRMALCVRRYRAAPPDVEREAMRQPHLGPRKVSRRLEEEEARGGWWWSVVVGGGWWRWWCQEAEWHRALTSASQYRTQQAHARPRTTSPFQPPATTAPPTSSMCVLHEHNQGGSMRMPACLPTNVDNDKQRRRQYICARKHTRRQAGRQAPPRCSPSLTTPGPTCLLLPLLLLLLLLQKKNISGDNIQGRVGRIYMPKQDVASMGLAKYKGTKRGRREDAAAAAAAKKQPRSGGGRGRVRGGGDDDDGGGSDDE